MPLWKRTISFIFKSWTAAVVIGSSLPMGLGIKTKEEEILRPRADDDFLRFNNQTQCLAALFEDIPIERGDNLVSSVPAPMPPSLPSFTLYGECTLSGEAPLIPKLWSKECHPAPEVRGSAVSDVSEQEEVVISDYVNKPETFALTINNLVHHFKQVQNRVRPHFEARGSSWSKLSFNGLAIWLQNELIENVLKREDFSEEAERADIPTWSYEKEKSNFDKAFTEIRSMIERKKIITPKDIDSLMIKIMGRFPWRDDLMISGNTPSFFAPGSIVKPAMQALCNYLKNEDLFDPQRDRLLVLTQALFVQVYILSLHPYKDGNGRLALLLANFILRAADMPPIPSRLGSLHASFLIQFTAFDQDHMHEIRMLLDNDKNPRHLFAQENAHNKPWKRLPPDEQMHQIRSVSHVNLSPFMALQFSEKDVVPNKKNTAKCEKILAERSIQQMDMLQQYFMNALDYYVEKAMPAVEEPAIFRRMP